MSKTLRIADNLTLPIDAVTQTFAIVAKRGAGKTNTAVDMAEEMLELQQQIIVIDPVGVWHGLRSGADGKSPGYSILVLGGDHGDIPLDPDVEAKQQMIAGEKIAHIVVEHRLSVILDMSNLRKHKQYAFLTGFFETLYRINRNAVHVFMDEADAYAPQLKLDQDNRLIGAVQDMVRRGRARGIGVTLISQRIAALSKDVLTQIEVLICLRTVGKHDLDAIKAWVEKNAEPEKLELLKADLPTLPIGTGWLWSPGWLQKLVKVNFRRRRTFDSSATPKVGEVRQQPKKLADISKARELFAVAAKEQKIAAVAIPATQTVVTKVEIREVEVPVLTDADRELLATFNTHAKGTINQIDSLILSLGHYRTDWELQVERVTAVLQKAQSVTSKPASVSRNGADPGQRGYPEAGRNLVGAPKPQPKAVTSGDSVITAPQMRILNALVVAHRVLKLEVVERSLLAVFSDYTPKTPAYRNNLGTLRTEGLIDYKDVNGKTVIFATERGLSVSTAEDAAPMTLADYQEAWLGRLTAPQRRIMEYLLKVWPQLINRRDLAPQVGYGEKTPAYRNNLGKLSTLGLIEYPSQGVIGVTDLMFPKQLMTGAQNHG